MLEKVVAVSAVMPAAVGDKEISEDMLGKSFTATLVNETFRELFFKKGPRSL